MKQEVIIKMMNLEKEVQEIFNIMWQSAGVNFAISMIVNLSL